MNISVLEYFDVYTLMTSKLLYLLMDWETVHLLEQVSGVIRALQTSMMVLLTKIVSKVNLKTLTILTKRLILDVWLGPGCASVDLYITFYEIQTKI